MLHRTVVVLVVLITFAVHLSAQTEWQQAPTAPHQVSKPAKLELAVQSGYSFGSFIRTYDGDLTLNGSMWYGGALDYYIKKDLVFELSYSYRSGSMTYEPYNYYGSWDPDAINDLGNLSTHYIQLGTIKTFRKNNVAPFIGGNLGMAIFSPEDQRYDTDLYFAVSGLGGAKIYLSDKIGIRLQGRLFMPLYFANLTFYCSTGGCGTGAGAWGTIEGELSGGLFFAF